VALDESDRAIRFSRQPIINDNGTRPAGFGHPSDAVVRNRRCALPRGKPVSPPEFRHLPTPGAGRKSCEEFLHKGYCFS
jgi:hypothetical protein